MKTTQVRNYKKNAAVRQQLITNVLLELDSFSLWTSKNTQHITGSGELVCFIYSIIINLIII